MQRDSWTKLTSARITRRRALVATSLGGAAAAFLAACGAGSSSSGGSSGTASAPGLLTKPVDTTKSAKRGGIFKDSAVSDAQYFIYDQNLNGNGSDGIAGWVYSRL